MNELDLNTIYRRYIACLNRRDWTSLGEFVHEHVSHNDRPFGLAGYRAMLEQDVSDIPDLQFNIDMLAVESPLVAARLRFDCAPKGVFMGLRIDGKRVVFTENVFYFFREGKIAQVWSVLDKQAIEAQL